MEKIEQNVKKINAYLDLERKVVGVRFLFNEAEYEESNFHSLKNRMSYCTTVSKATRGKDYKIKLENFACLAAANALGLYPTHPLKEFGKTRLTTKVYDNLCISRQVSKSMVYCGEGIYALEVGPLEMFDQEPDVVIIVSNPYNVMRIAQGYAFYHGHIKEAQFAGMQAMCQECTSYPFERNTINISMMCSGTRMLARWGVDELGVGMPYHLFDSVVDGIKQTINPLERNKQKKKIEERIQNSLLKEDFIIEYNKNYDDGGYFGLQGCPKDSSK